MKSRLRLYALIGLFAFAIGFLWVYLLSNNQEDLAVLSATVNRDCAPWDGSAFTVLIPYNASTNILISIWQSPDIKLPVKYTFPDESMRAGNAIFQSPSGEYEQLTGRVSFLRVDRERPVQGDFDLRDESGNQFRGKFIAEWGNEVAYCG